MKVRFGCRKPNGLQWCPHRRKIGANSFKAQIIQTHFILPNTILYLIKWQCSLVWCKNIKKWGGGRSVLTCNHYWRFSYLALVRRWVEFCPHFHPGTPRMALALYGLDRKDTYKGAQDILNSIQNFTTADEPSMLPTGVTQNKHLWPHYVKQWPAWCSYNRDRTLLTETVTLPGETNAFVAYIKGCWLRGWVERIIGMCFARRFAWSPYFKCHCFGRFNIPSWMRSVQPKILFSIVLIS